MKKITTILLMCICFIGKINAQLASASADLDINNVRAKVMNCGDMFWDIPNEKAAYEFPKGSGKTSNSTASLWIGGIDASTQTLKIAAQTYRQTGTDFWPGPLSTTSTMDMIKSAQWDKLWKVNKSDIVAFKALTTHTVANTPPSILDWPAKGNPYVLDANSVPLVVTQDLAPFVDINNDGNYNPLDGDYPQIKGEQSIWWVFNDQKNHDVTGSDPLNIQVKAMAYACVSDPQLTNVTYYNYEISNFSTTQINNVRIGFYDDIDLGYAFDDFIGFDTIRRMGITYNGDSFDEGVNGYDSSLTQVGYILLTSPNDNAFSKEAIGSYTFLNNNFSDYGNPTTAQHYYNYINGKWKIIYKELQCT